MGFGSLSKAYSFLPARIQLYMMMDYIGSEHRCSSRDALSLRPYPSLCVYIYICMYMYTCTKDQSDTTQWANAVTYNYPLD